MFPPTGSQQTTTQLKEYWSNAMMTAWKLSWLQGKSLGGKNTPLETKLSRLSYPDG